MIQRSDLNLFPSTPIPQHAAVTRTLDLQDFGVGTPEGEAALYERFGEYVVTHVRPHRLKNKRASPARLLEMNQQLQQSPGAARVLAATNSAE